MYYFRGSTSGFVSVMPLDVSSLVSENSIVLLILLYLLATAGAQTQHPYFFTNIWACKQEF